MQSPWGTSKTNGAFAPKGRPGVAPPCVIGILAPEQPMYAGCCCVCAPLEIMSFRSPKSIYCDQWRHIYWSPNVNPNTSSPVHGRAPPFLRTCQQSLASRLKKKPGQQIFWRDLPISLFLHLIQVTQTLPRCGRLTHNDPQERRFLPACPDPSSHPGAPRLPLPKAPHRTQSYLEVQEPLRGARRVLLEVHEDVLHDPTPSLRA